MTKSPRADQVDFIRLGGHTVRATSWKPEEASGAYRLVTITRGSRDAELLDELLSQPGIQVKVPGQDFMHLQATEIDRREFGQGQSAITRFEVLFTQPGTSIPVPVPSTEDPPSLEHRVAALEAEVAELKSLVARLVQKS